MPTSHLYLTCKCRKVQRYEAHDGQQHSSMLRAAAADGWRITDLRRGEGVCPECKRKEREGEHGR